jgi:hypothetical protein
MTDPSARRQDIALAAIAGILGVGTVAWVVLWARYGLDFSDEGYYLNFIANPHAYTASTTEFAFIYHPIFLLLGDNIVLLRQFSIILTAILTTVFLYLTLSPRTPSENRLEAAGRLGVAALFAPAGLLFNVSALATPSYNSLNMQALLIAGIGFALIRKVESRDDGGRFLGAGYGLLGLAGCLAFLAKPTTAVALGVLALAWMLLVSKRKSRGILGSVLAAVGFMIAAVILIDGTPDKFIGRLMLGYSQSQMMDSGHSPREILRIGDISLSAVGRVNFVAWTSLAAAFTFLAASGSRFGKAAGWCASLLFGGAALLILIGVIRLPAGFFAPAMIIALPALGVAGATAALLLTKPHGAWCRRDSLHALCLTFVPYAYAFGSAENYWLIGGEAGIFWIAAGVMLLKSVSPPTAAWPSVAPLAMITNCVAVLILGAGFDAPYRQSQPLRLNDRVVRLGGFAPSPIISAAAANYIEGLRALAAANGFRQGDPVIDLTGAHPTALFAMGALPIGQAWTIGGYPGSIESATAVLGIVPCGLIARAWLLTETDGPRSLPVRIVGVPGLTYRAVGALPAPDSSRQQQLQKPTLAVSQGAALCERARGAAAREPATR